MKRLRGALATTILMLGACNQHAPPNQPTPADVEHQQPTPPIPPPETGPDARTPLGEPTHDLDPKSAEAAAQVVRDYADLVAQGRVEQAARLWSDPAAGGAFAAALQQETHVRIGKVGPTEGAAGSIYANVETTFFGENSSRSAEVVLQRVNDVPGSTEEQRHWHIERINWKASP